MVDFTLSNPAFLVFLLALPLIIITHFFTLRFLKRRAFKFANFEAIRRVTGGQDSIRNVMFVSKNWWVLIARLLVMLLLILAVAGPTIFVVGQRTDFDFVIAIDASASMLADDYAPSRLGAANAASANFMDQLTSRSSVGLVSFAGTSFVEQDITSELYEVKNAIEDIHIKRVGGTDIGGAIVTSTNMLVTYGGKTGTRSKAIIMLTDGQSNVGTPIKDAIDHANDNHVVIYTIGIATKEGGSFLRTDLISTIDEETLQGIAESTGGKFYRINTEQDFNEAFTEIATSTKEPVPIDLRLPFILTAITLVFVEWGLISTKYRTIP
ncbi:VWA domain-containing protein [Candidatus Woesearchaeota archaeon]|nr:VWA domain-containing protein [Candidatus Woesearchaeota archaeon]